MTLGSEVLPQPAAVLPASRFAAIETRIDALGCGTEPDTAPRAVAELLQLGEEILEIWVCARGQEPTHDSKEEFRLLALHRQGARGEPSFNACRETARELVYHYNLILSEPAHPQIGRRLQLAAMVAKHLCLFVSGKMQVAGLGEFCCAAKPLRGGGQ